jgi:hypothetical protein
MMGPLWTPILAPYWPHIGPILGPSWAHHGPVGDNIWAHMGPCLGPQLATPTGFQTSKQTRKRFIFMFNGYMDVSRLFRYESNSKDPLDVAAMCYVDNAGSLPLHRIWLFLN